MLDKRMLTTDKILQESIGQVSVPVSQYAAKPG